MNAMIVISLLSSLSIFTTFTFIFSCPVEAHGAVIHIDKGVEDLGDARTNQEATYLAYNLPYEPFKHIIPILERFLNRKLKTRGKAHITLITPPEMAILRSKVSHEELWSLFEERRAGLTISIVCIGEGQALIRDKLERTFFLVVTSPGLMDAREEVARMAQHRGAAENDFKAEEYHPHITLGFTKEDLHIHHGVIKDTRSCNDQFTLVKD